MNVLTLMTIWWLLVFPHEWLRFLVWALFDASHRVPVWIFY